MMIYNKIQFKYYVLLLTLIGACLRFYNLGGSLQFLGDQGRDALIHYRLLIHQDLVFIGPVTSVGNMYLGPAYYYLTLPFYALSYPSPLGPVYFIALLGTFTIPLVYVLGKELVGKKAALFGTFIYTFSAIFIELTRFSWNPNPAPFVSMIMVWATYRAYVKNSKYWVLVSVCFCLLIQFHYLTLLALIPTGIIWLFAAAKQDKDKRISFFALSLFSVLLFLVSLTPLVLFDFRHEFINAKAFYNILFGKEEQIRGQSQGNLVVLETFGRSLHILFETTLGKMRMLNTALVTIVYTVLLWLGISSILKEQKRHQTLFKSLSHSIHVGRAIVVLWLITGVIGTSLYKSTVFDHYVAYLFPVVALVLGIVLEKLWHTGVLRIAVIGFMALYLVANFFRYDYRTKGWSVYDMARYSTEIEKYVTAGEAYTLILLTSYQDIYAMNYRYFLTVSGKGPLETENANASKKLIILDDMNLPLQDILDSPVYEIVIFPDKSAPQVIQYNEGPKMVILEK